MTAQAADPVDLLNSLPTAMIVVDGGDYITFANPAAETLLQTSIGQLRCMTLDELFGPGSAIAALIRHSREHMMPVADSDVHVSTARSTAERVSISTAPVFCGGAPSPAGDMIVEFAPISIAHRINQQMRRQGVARSTAGMVAVLAHEVRNPLAGIRGAAQIIEGSVEGDEKALTRLIADEVDRISNLIQRIDVFAEIGPPPRASVNIHEPLDRAMRVLDSSGAFEGIRVQEAYDPSLPTVRGEFEGLVQIFINLLKNAADAAHDGGGEIVIRTSYRHGMRLAADRRSETGMLPIVVEVQDNGPGIPEDLQGAIFDPFVTTKQHGHGLGLAVVAKIIGDHGGAVDFESEPHRTIFTLYLPVFVDAEMKP